MSPGKKTLKTKKTLLDRFAGRVSKLRTQIARALDRVDQTDQWRVAVLDDLLGYWGRQAYGWSSAFLGFDTVVLLETPLYRAVKARRAVVLEEARKDTLGASYWHPTAVLGSQVMTAAEGWLLGYLQASNPPKGGAKS